MTSLERKAFVSRWILIITTIDLLLLFTAKTLVWPIGGREPNVTIWLFHIVPLLPFLPGLFKKKHRHYVGLCYVVIVYFMASGGNLFNSVVDIYDWLTVAACVVIYLAGLFGSKWQKQLETQQQSEQLVNQTAEIINE